MIDIALSCLGNVQILLYPDWTYLLYAIYLSQHTEGYHSPRTAFHHLGFVIFNLDYIWKYLRGFCTGVYFVGVIIRLGLRVRESYRWLPPHDHDVVITVGFTDAILFSNDKSQLICFIFHQVDIYWDFTQIKLASVKTVLAKAAHLTISEISIILLHYITLVNN